MLDVWCVLWLFGHRIPFEKSDQIGGLDTLSNKLQAPRLMQDAQVLLTPKVK